MAGCDGSKAFSMTSIAHLMRVAIHLNAPLAGAVARSTKEKL
jgi:hypothetical protein